MAAASVKVVTGVIGHDCHVTGTRVLEMFLKRAGIDVVGLGCMNMQEAFVEAATETDADAILVSSLYGQGFMDCQGFRDRLVEAGLGDITLYIGGNLAVGEDRNWSEVKEKFTSLGFNRVYGTDADLGQMLQDLLADVAARRGSSVVVGGRK